MPATVAHAWDMAPRMRHHDALEVYRWSGRYPLEACLDAIQVSEVAWAGLIDDDTVALFGLARPLALGDWCVPWALTTDLVEQHKRTFLRISHAVLHGMLRHAGRLAVCVDDDYDEAKRWLLRLGFQLGPAFRAGPENHLFREASMEARHV